MPGRRFAGHNAAELDTRVSTECVNRLKAESGIFFRIRSGRSPTYNIDSRPAGSSSINDCLCDAGRPNCGYVCPPIVDPMPNRRIWRNHAINRRPCHSVQNPRINTMPFKHPGVKTTYKQTPMLQIRVLRCLACVLTACFSKRPIVPACLDGSILGDVRMMTHKQPGVIAL